MAGVGMDVLEARELRKGFRVGRQWLEAVRGVSLQLRAGEVLAFLGPNGAGKTTTIKMIAGLVYPDQGRVSIVGQDPFRQPQALGEVGAVLEGNRNVYWRLTPEQNLEYFGALKGLSRRQARQRGEILLEKFELISKRRVSVQTLSRGMQQKLAIAVALIHDPKLLLLDEPTLGLDVEATLTVKELIRQIAKEGRGILLTTHQLNIAEELSDRVSIIQKGQIIAESSTQDLIRQFSGATFMIQIEGEMDPVRIKLLESMGAEIRSPDQFSYTGSAAGLYEVLAALKPLPLLSIQRDQADLTQVFLRLVRQHG